MVRLITAIFCILVLIPWPCGAEDLADKTQILEPGGPFHGDEVTVKSEDGWFALVVEESIRKAFLIEGRIEVSLVKDEVVDTEGQKTGKEIKFIPKEKENKIPPKILIKSPGLIAGEIRHLSSELSDNFGLVGQHKEIQLSLNSSLHLYSTGEVSSDNHKTTPQVPFTIRDMCLNAAVVTSNLTQPSKMDWKKQKLQCFDIAYPFWHFSILWVGDVNNDKRIDIVLKGHFENRVELKLFLADPSGKELFLNPVVQELTGC